MTTYYYICDGCGNLANITEAPLPEDENWICDKCRSAALWEFTNKDKALAASRQIQAAEHSRLFRRAGR